MNHSPLLENQVIFSLKKSLDFLTDLAEDFGLIEHFKDFLSVRSGHLHLNFLRFLGF